jgi:hypothetical protein
MPTQDTVETARQKGRQEGFQELLLHLLRQRFREAVNTQAEQRVAKASIEQIEIWARRVLSAATLDESLAD